MRSVAVMLLATGAALAAAASAPAKLPTFTAGTRIDPGRAIAGVKLGASQEKAEKTWGPGQCSTAGDVTICAYLGPGVPSLQGQASFTVRGGNVESISVNAGYTAASDRVVQGPLARLKTSKGIGLGSPSGAVKQAYPKATKPSPNRYRLVGPGTRVTEFTLVKGKVSDIRVSAAG